MHLAGAFAPHTWENNMTVEETTDYLDTLPGVLALWWFMENINDEHPDRQQLFFYLRERVRRYQYNADRADQRDAHAAELAYDSEMFKRMA
jgi:hypothetical protein